MCKKFNLYQFFKYSIVRRVKTYLARIKLLFIRSPALNSTHRNPKIIVSLTSFGARINNIDLTIKTLFNQSLCADKIVLNLSKHEFNQSNLPNALIQLQKFGLEINYVDDTRSYKKLIPTLINYPNDIIITVDDDILYPHYLIQSLMQAYTTKPHLVHGCRGYQIELSEYKTVKHYKDWTKCRTPQAGNNVMLTGIGAILYGPGCFHKDVLRQDLFTKLAPSADDLWFKAMCLLNGTGSQVIIEKKQFNTDFLPTSNSNIDPLCSMNVDEGQNDHAMANIIRAYPELINHFDQSPSVPCNESC